ncbi:MAG: YerC/YecD family TrpR-related protein [Patescibacteria group bacterium]|jgi:TrpR-related protein YerC/YecD
MDKRLRKTIWNAPANQALILAISKLKNKREIQNYLRDLLTESEIKEFSARWQAARMLDRNVPYTKIVKDTGLSSTTVARVQRWLQHGTNGYRLMIDRLNRKKLL